MTLLGSFIGLHALWQLEVAIRLAFALTAICGAALLVARFLPSENPQARHGVLSWALAASLATPAAAGLMPAVPLVYSLPSSMAHVDNLPRLGGTRAAVAGLLGADDAVASPDSRARGPGPAAWLALLWAGGAGFLGIRLLEGRTRLRRGLRAPPEVPPAVERALSAGRRAFGLRRDVRLLRTAAFGSPLTFGFLRPTVVLPADAIAWPEETLRAILWHELAHVRRTDWLWQSIGLAACVAFWFHPMVWLVAARQRQEAELAADADAVRRGISASRYARALVRIAAHPVGRAFPTAPAARTAIALAPASCLETRLRAVRDGLRTAGRRQPRRVSFAVLGAVVLLLVSTATAVAAPVLATGCHREELTRRAAADVQR